jgi:hypothetical protein
MLLRFGFASILLLSLGLPRSFAQEGTANPPLQLLAINEAPLPSPLGWPSATTENHPFTRWWWLGSAVDEANLTRLLTAYHEAGIGGVEICPIYGVKGNDVHNLEFLSPDFMRMMRHAVREGSKLDMAVDFTTGTGWPFGGPTVNATDASTKVTVVQKRITATPGMKVEIKLPDGTLRAAFAYPEKGDKVDLSTFVTSHNLSWEAPAGKYQVVLVCESEPIQKVKRAAPGGEGNVLDPFQPAAIDRYLGHFTDAFQANPGPAPRTHFHDSFEYFGADWTPELFEEFQKRRGYDLRDQLAELFGDTPTDNSARVKCDYRETLAELHLDYMRHWTDWCHSQGSLSRNQAHGAPCNLVDLYAGSDIPECEIFRDYEDSQQPMLKLASSAAHLRNHRLSSSESFTWLRDHFHASLADVKKAADALFLAGVNHIFFHGIPYSPENAVWPGWQFYAAVNFGPQGGLWHDLPAFTGYLTRCQSLLQWGRPDNDVLLYLPIHDFWQHDGPGHNKSHLTLFVMPGKWMEPHDVHSVAMSLAAKGYGYDAISDHLISEARVNERGHICLGQQEYRALVLPTCHVMPVETLKKVIALVEAGGTVMVHEDFAKDVPGFAKLEERRAEQKELLAALAKGEEQHSASGVSLTKLGKGQLVRGKQPTEQLAALNIVGESLPKGVSYIRRTHAAGKHYFLVNRGEDAIHQWVPLNADAMSVVVLDPRFIDHTGLAKLRKRNPSGCEVWLDLRPGESLFLRAFESQAVEGPAWQSGEPMGAPIELSGKWEVSFLEGGPELPKAHETTAASALPSWTTFPDEETKRFQGTAKYRHLFSLTELPVDNFRLELGKVCASARVVLNGQPLGTAWSEPFTIDVPGSALRPGENVLEIEVTNLAANRIADLDRRNVEWKIFKEINIVNREYKPLDAASWPTLDSGLLGPVRLQRMKPSEGN